MIGDRQKAASPMKVEKRIRDAFRLYVSPQEADRLVRLALFRARDDNKMLAFCLEHIFGKPAESVAISGPGGQPISIHISEAVAMRNKLQIRDVESSAVVKEPKKLTNGTNSNK